MNPRLQVRDLAQPEQLQVRQRITDNFVQPSVDRDAGSDLQQVGSALSNLSPSLTQALSARRALHRQEASDARDAGAQAREEAGLKKAYRTAVKDGDIEEADNPFFAEGFNRNLGQTLARDFRETALDEFAASPAANSEDPTEIHQFFRSLANDLSGASDSEDFRESYWPSATEAVDSLTNDVMGRVKEAQRVRSYEQAQLRIQDIVADPDLDPASDFSAIASNLQTFGQEQFANGVDGSFLRQTMLEEIGRYAVESGNPALFSNLATRIKLGSGPISETVQAREMMDEIVNRAEAEQQVQRRAASTEMHTQLQRLADDGATSDQVSNAIEVYQQRSGNALSQDDIERVQLRASRQRAARLTEAQTINRREAIATTEQDVFNAGLALLGPQVDQDGNVRHLGLSTLTDQTVTLPDGSTHDMTAEEIKLGILSTKARGIAEDAAAAGVNPDQAIMQLYAQHGEIEESQLRSINQAAQSASDLTLRVLRDGGNVDDAELNPALFRGFDLYRTLTRVAPGAADQKIDRSTNIMFRAAEAKLQLGMASNEEEAIRSVLNDRVNHGEGSPNYRLDTTDTTAVSSLVDQAIRRDRSYFIPGMFESDLKGQAHVQNRATALFREYRRAGVDQESTVEAVKTALQNDFTSLNGHLVFTAASKPLPGGDRYLKIRLRQFTEDNPSEDADGLMYYPEPSAPNTWRLRDRYLNPVGDQFTFQDAALEYEGFTQQSSDLAVMASQEARAERERDAARDAERRRVRRQGLSFNLN